MRFKHSHHLAAVALATLAGIGVIAAPSASAEPATTLATRAQLILDCLQDGYVPGYIEKTRSQTTGAYYTLDCGRQDPDANLSFGVLHVDNGHTIPRTLAGAQQFYLCFVRLIQYGVTDQGALTGTTKWSSPNRDDPNVAGYTWNRDSKINTMFTPGDASNNWAGCSQ